MGFGGPRVVEHVTGQPPTPISHTAESAYAHGLVDALLGEDDIGPWIDGQVALDGSSSVPPGHASTTDS